MFSHKTLIIDYYLPVKISHTRVIKFGPKKRSALTEALLIGWFLTVTAVIQIIATFVPHITFVFNMLLNITKFNNTEINFLFSVGELYFYSFGAVI